MRVLRLGLGDAGAVDLHPSVSVVTGLTERQHTALRRGFRAIGTGLSPRSAGLVEAHGLLLDTAQDDLDLLEVPATPASTVATAAGVPGAIPEAAAERLRTAERDLLVLAAERWRACRGRTAIAEARREVATTTGASGRAAELRARIARHAALDPESVRVALDQARDADRAGVAPAPAGLEAALARVGLDVADLGLPVPELVGLAQDWLEEHHAEGERVVGATVELAGIERSGDGPATDEDDAALAVRRRASRAGAAHVEAVVRVDELHAALVARHQPRPDLDALQAHLADRLTHHRPERLAGAVPLVLDGLLGHLDADEVVALLDRTSGLAGAVQLVVVDEHPAAKRWADSVGFRRAAVVSPSSTAEAPPPT
ncbi:MAG: hypothetical protein ACLGIZ_13230 [Acidimicrobiia bacterium]